MKSGYLELRMGQLNWFHENSSKAATPIGYKEITRGHIFNRWKIL